MLIETVCERKQPHLKKIFQIRLLNHYMALIAIVAQRMALRDYRIVRPIEPSYARLVYPEAGPEIIQEI